MDLFNENLIPDDVAIKTFRSKTEKIFIPFIIKKRSDKNRKSISKFTKSFPSSIARQIEKCIEYEVKQEKRKDYFCIPYGEENLRERIMFITDYHDKLFLSVFYTYRLLHKSYAPNEYVLDNKVVDYKNKIIHDFTEKRGQFNGILAKMGLSPGEEEASVMRKPFFTEEKDFEKAKKYFEKVKKIKDARETFEEIKKIYDETVEILAPMSEQWVAETLIFCIKHSAIIDDLIPNIKNYTFEDKTLKEGQEDILISNSYTLERIFELKDLYDFFDELVEQINDNKRKDALKIFTEQNYREYRYYVLEKLQESLDREGINFKQKIKNKNLSSSILSGKPNKDLLSQEVLALDMDMDSQIDLVYLKEQTKVYFKLWEQKQDFAYKELKEEEVEKYFLINLHNKFQDLESKFTNEFGEIFKDWRNLEKYPMIFLRQIDVMDRYESLKQLREQILNLLGYKFIPSFLSLEQLKDIYEKIKKENRLFSLFLTLLTEQVPRSPPISFMKSLEVFYPNALKYFMTDKTVFYAPPVIKRLGLQKNRNIDKIYLRINLYQNVFHIDKYGRDLVTKYYKDPEKVYVIPDVRCYLVEEIVRKRSAKIDYDFVSILVIGSDGNVKLSNGEKINFFPNPTDHYLSVINFVSHKKIFLALNQKEEKILEGDVQEKLHQIKELAPKPSEKTSSSEISKIIEKIQGLKEFDEREIKEIVSDITSLENLTNDERELINEIYSNLSKIASIDEKLNIMNLLFDVLKQILQSTSKSPVVVEPKKKSAETSEKKSKIDQALETLSKSIKDFEESFLKLKEKAERSNKKDENYLVLFSYILNELRYIEGILVSIKKQKINLEKILEAFLVEPNFFPSDDVLKEKFLYLQSLVRTFPGEKDNKYKIEVLKNIAKAINDITLEIQNKEKEIKGATEGTTTSPKKDTITDTDTSINTDTSTNTNNS